MKIGDTLAGRYEVRATLGAGGLGEVFVSRDTRSQRDVAVKVFDPTRCPADRLAAMATLLAAASRVDHPALVLPKIQVGLSERPPFVVSELIPGEDLAALLAREKCVPWQRALALVLTCVEGLAAAAKATGRPHGALKPGNIRVTPNGEARVLDYGIGELGAAEPPRPRSDGNFAEYRAPEQIQGAPLDARTDVFALGVLLFELLTGVHPFTGSTAHKAMWKVSMPTLSVQPSELAPATPLPSQVEKLLVRALARAPADRFRELTDMAHHLALVLRSPGTPTRARPASATTDQRTQSSPESLARSRTSVPHRKIDEEMTQTIAPSATPEELTTMLNIPVAHLLKKASSDSSEALVSHTAQNKPQPTPEPVSDLPREPAQVLPSLPSVEVPPVLPGVSDPELSEPTSVLPRRLPAKATAVEPLEATVAFTRRPVDRTAVDGARPAQRQSHLPDTTLELPTGGPVAEAPRRAIDMSADTEATSLLVRPPPTPRSDAMGSMPAREPTALTPSTTDQQRENTLKRTFLILNVVCLLLVVLVVYFLLS